MAAPNPFLSQLTSSDPSNPEDEELQAEEDIIYSPPRKEPSPPPASTTIVTGIAAGATVSTTPNSNVKVLTIGSVTIYSGKE